MENPIQYGLKTLNNHVKIPKLSFHIPDFVKKNFLWILFAISFCSAYVMMAGVIYDLINEPGHVGTRWDEKTGRKTIETVMQRMNGQYVLEGMYASMFIFIGSVSVLGLNFAASQPGWNNKVRITVAAVCGVAFLLSFILLNKFITIKVPGYSRL